MLTSLDVLQARLAVLRSRVAPEHVQQTVVVDVAAQM